MRLTQNGDLAMLLLDQTKRMILRLEEGKLLQTHKGMIQHDDIIGIPWGSEILSHLGITFTIVDPSLRDVLLEIRRKTQIIFPKDIGYILLRLSVAPGKRVVEAGSGSGALTTAFAWMVGSTGKVISYERREDMLDLAKENLNLIGLADRVEFHLADIYEGIEEDDVDAFFLDLPFPQKYLGTVKNTLVNGGVLGCILPTTNQVSELLLALENHGFGVIEVAEIILRFYKPVPARLRPTDRMVSHTGYLVFARSLVVPETPSV